MSNIKRLTRTISTTSSVALRPALYIHLRPRAAACSMYLPGPCCNSEASRVWKSKTFDAVACADPLTLFFTLLAATEAPREPGPQLGEGPKVGISRSNRTTTPLETTALKRRSLLKLADPRGPAVSKERRENQCNAGLNVASVPAHALGCACPHSDVPFSICPWGHDSLQTAV
jgi:hypothetical protein